MHDKPKHFCGVVGMALTTDVRPSLSKALRVIQHRGQEAAGIVSVRRQHPSVRGMGLVHEVLTGRSSMRSRATSASATFDIPPPAPPAPRTAQPISVTILAGDLALAHNGDIVNADKLRAKLQSEGWAFLTTTDSEIIVRLLATELLQTPTRYGPSRTS